MYLMINENCWPYCVTFEMNFYTVISKSMYIRMYTYCWLSSLFMLLFSIKCLSIEIFKWAPWIHAASIHTPHIHMCRVLSTKMLAWSFMKDEKKDCRKWIVEGTHENANKPNLCSSQQKRKKTRTHIQTEPFDFSDTDDKLLTNIFVYDYFSMFFFFTWNLEKNSPNSKFFSF